MNIRVITRHAPSNYGSLLQSMATIKVLNKLGHQCKIIDYIRKDERGLRQNLCYLRNNKVWNSNVFTRILFVVLRLPEELLAEFRFNYLRKKNLCLTPRYNTLEELSTIKTDIFCTGSDQVWGNVVTGTYDPAYFLSFAKDGQKKIAFSASFGRTDFDACVLEEYKTLLSSYSGITVRESQAVELLNRMNIHCDGHVLDPTLFLDKDEWLSLIPTKEIKGDFVLIYQVHNDREINEYAKRFAQKHKLKLVRIAPYFHHITRGGRFVYLPNISVFLSYFRYCKYLITDSFHGTSFALNLNKQFQVILSKDNTGSRILSLLKLVGQENRLTPNMEDLDSLFYTQIDYEKVNDILDVERRKSYALLEEML